VVHAPRDQTNYILYDYKLVTLAHDNYDKWSQYKTKGWRVIAIRYMRKCLF
jgi:hypothetical protein